MSDSIRTKAELMEELDRLRARVAELEFGPQRAVVAEQELLETRQRLHHLLASSPSVIYSCGIGPDYPTTFISENIFTQLGYRPDEFYKDPLFWTKQIHPKDVDRVLRELSHIDEAGCVSYEYRLRHKDGHYVWLHDEVAPLNDAGGNVRGVVGSWFDITDRKRADERLRESETNLRSIIEHSNELFYVHDCQHQLNYVSPRSKEIFGYTPEEMMVKWTTLTTDSPINDVGLALTEKAIKTGERQGAYLLEIRRKDGELRIIEVNESPIKDEQGKVFAISGASRDITERKRAEERLLLLSSAVEQSTEGVEVVDLEGNLLFANEAFALMHGYAPEEVLHQHLSIFHTPDQMPSVEEANRLVRETGEFSGDIWHARRDGQVFLAHIRNTLVRDGVGRPVAMIAAARDITEQKETEDALRESEARYRNLFDRVPVGLYRSTSAGRILAANLALVRMLGYPDCDSLLKRNANSLYVESNDRRRLLRGIDQNGVALDLEYQLRRYDGTPIWVKENVRTIRDSSGAVLCYEGSLEDITERKRAVEELQQAHDELERRVEERTTDITAVNRRLQREISEHRQTEEALQKSEKKHRVLIENLPQKVFYKDRDSVYVSCNDNYAKDLGIKPEEIVGKTDYEFFPKELAEKYRADDRKLMVSGATIEIEEKYLHDGQELIVQTVKTPVRNENGDIIGVLGIFWDITDHKRAEEQLEVFLHCIECSLDGMAMGDLDGRITYVNKAFAGMFGYSIEELTGKEISSIYSHEQIPKLNKAIKATLEGGWTGELIAKRKNGELFPVAVASSRVLDNQGKIIAHLTNHQDITERKRAEEALRESEERLRTVVSASKDAMIAIDEEGLVTLFNPAAERMFGRSSRAMLGQPLDCLIPEEYRERHGEYVEGYFARGEPHGVIGETVELPAVRSDGQQFPIELSLSIGQRGGQRFALGVIRDITKRKRAEEELRRAKEVAETANQAKSRFLANISHEIRTPITAMLGAAELLTAVDTERADHHHRSDVILRNGRHLLSLIDDLLDLSRAEAGKLEIQRARCSLLEILADIRAVTEPLHQDEMVDFRLFCEGTIPAHIHTDPTRLKQAVINLINNALKFTIAGHVYTRVSVNRTGAEPRLTIAVEDTGVGIPPKDIERIFDTFAQVAPDSSRIRSGVGLGLPLVKWIAQQLGGTIEVTSAEGCGSTFTLRVATGPLDDVDWVTPSEAVSPQPLYTVREHPAARFRLRGNILLAEDFRDVRDLISHTLTQAGVEVKAVHNGEEAVKAAGEHDFDLILLDVRMPGMDGPTAAAELRRRGCLTPIIALTASTTGSDHERIVAAGFDDLWPKPISLERLVERVADYVSADRDDTQNDAAAATTSSTRLTDDPRMAPAMAEFSRNLPARLKKLRDLVDAGDLQQAREVLHQLVGVAGILGYMSLSDEAARVLVTIKDGSFSGADNLRPLEDLVNEISRGLRNDQSVPESDAL